MKKSIAVIVIMCLGVVMILSLPWLIYNSFLNNANVQVPVLKNGEFPFKLVYQINDEVITVEDTYICEYKGAKWNWNIGGYRKWKGYIKGTGKDAVQVLNDGEYDIEILVGGVKDYMKLAYAFDSNCSLDPMFNKAGPYGSSLSLSNEEALEQYGIEIISFEHADPVQALHVKDNTMDIVD